MTVTHDYKNISQGTLKLVDGDSPTPAELTIVGIDGGMKIGKKTPHAAVMSRNSPIAWAAKKNEPIEISFTIHFVEWEERTTAAGGEATSPENFMRGEYTDFASVGDGGPFSFDMVLTLAASGSSADQTETITLNDCVLDDCQFEEGEETTKMSFSIRALSMASVRS